MGPGPGLVVAMAIAEEPKFTPAVKTHLDTLPNDKYILIGCLIGGSSIFNNPASFTHVFDTEADAHAWWSGKHGQIKGYRVYYKNTSGRLMQVFGPS
jgi:hypothetical protein